MNKKIIVLISYFIIGISKIYAQYTLDWQQNANQDQKQSVMSTIDSQDNIIVTGYLQNNQIFTRKLDISGTLIWETPDSSGINSIYEKPNWISSDSNDNIYVVGNQYSISSSYDYPSAIVALKYSPTGTMLWRTLIPISILINSQTSFDCRSAVDESGNLYIGTAINIGAVLYKLDSNGNLIFTNASTENAPKNFNGMRIKNNKIAIVTSSGTPNVAPVFVWDTSGALLWTANAVGGLAADVEIDENENVYVLSHIYHMINPISWDYDARLIKYSPTGSLLWNYNYDFGGYNFVTRMTYVNNRISAIGYGNSSGLKWQTFQTDADGTLLWSSPYNEPTPLTVSDSYPRFILAKPTGEVIVTGVGGPTPDPFNPSFNQMPIVQYSNTGVQNWLDTPNIYAGTGLAITLASDGSLYALGSRNMYVFHYNNVITSINQSNKDDNTLIMYPNPFTANIKISFYKYENTNDFIIITNVAGEVVKSIPTNNLLAGQNEIEINLSELNNGIYFCTVKSKNGVSSSKIIKY
jgi:hypothetical protein